MTVILKKFDLHIPVTQDRWTDGLTDAPRDVKNFKNAKIPHA